MMDGEPVAIPKSFNDRDRELVTEFIDFISVRPRRFHNEPSHNWQMKAQRYMIVMLDLCSRACGDDIICEAYGPKSTDRVEALYDFSARAQLAAYAFGVHDHGRGSLSEAASEARAVAQGDEPVAFAKLGRRRAIRLLRTKLQALRWDSWLSGLAIPTAERHGSIELAYGAEWDTISRWRSDVRTVWGEEVLSQIASDRRDAEQGLRMDIMRPGEEWSAGLKRAGDGYKAALRAR